MTTMTCNCIEIVNEKLKEHNTRILEPMFIGGDQTRRVFIETEQIEKGRGKQKASAMFATYCPFCGVVCREEAPAEPS
jgi:hypothetical protein